MTHNAVVIDPSDNVATVLAEIGARDQVICDSGLEIVAREAIPLGHKVAIVAIPKGEMVRKYGHPIGIAEHRIAAGEHVHGHNLARQCPQFLKVRRHIQCQTIRRGDIRAKWQDSGTGGQFNKRFFDHLHTVCHIENLYDIISGQQ